MHYRPLGDTGLSVSEIALGTAQIGMDYGFKGNSDYGKPDVNESIHLLHTALGHGSNVIATARSYGNREEINGKGREGMGCGPYLPCQGVGSNGVVYKHRSEVGYEI